MNPWTHQQRAQRFRQRKSSGNVPDDGATASLAAAKRQPTTLVGCAYRPRTRGHSVMTKTFEDYAQDADKATERGDAPALAAAIAAMRVILAQDKADLAALEQAAPPSP